MDAADGRPAALNPPRKLVFVALQATRATAVAARMAVAGFVRRAKSAGARVAGAGMICMANAVAARMAVAGIVRRAKSAGALAVA
jgi:hypothetical protein